ncbi:MCE family protein [Mycobacteroides abscessus]|uniref:MCE family protein n=1 Tax=Mycobacteroides abscessus TaxID=36809 RepID=UPI000927F050|nr:MCE family protein [Mycobacteroides abscessus]MDO3333933.1 MCE family protein [Mycobacteroides abscessus subsp. bolletii]QSM86858.1 MCE family protein [Mycobacteroides abscessus subsp. bolletii]SIB90368.1 MCE-family protein Mce6C [Mycobacteroides abscessus subsp. bolletii]SKS87283.1 MCE-family protein Mce6C [Mycobacteroides abscessus subsp. bolletii]SKT10718.1 MCE-family protein Mce6C [Mycobacteroides abscessus subsp. bolletii]
MLNALKRPVEQYNKVLLGVAAVTVIAVICAGIIGFGQFAIGKSKYRGEFAQAAQISIGDQVTIAGISVGEVRGVQLAGDRVVVDFTVGKNVRLGAQTRAAIKLTTLLGRRYLELSPAGAGALDHHTIAMQNTSVPYNLQQTLADATTTFEQVDADRVADSMTSLSQGLTGVPEALPQALANITTLANIVASRRDQIGSLLANVDTVTAMIRDQKANLGVLVLQGRDLLTEVTTRADKVHRLIDGVTALIKTFKRILGDEPAIDSMLANLQTFADMAGKNDELLRAFLQAAPVAFRNMANVTGSGTAFDVSLPGGVLIDSWMCAISQRAKQFNLAQYFTDCSPAPDPFPGWPPPDPARLPG